MKQLAGETNALVASRIVVAQQRATRCLARSQPQQSSRGTWISWLTVLSALGVAFVPKCPMCLIAYSGVLALFGLELVVVTWLRPVMMAVLAAVVLVVLTRALRARTYVHALILLTGVAIVVAGQGLGQGIAWQSAGILCIWISFVCAARGAQRTGVEVAFPCCESVASGR